MPEQTEAPAARTLRFQHAASEVAQRTVLRALVKLAEQVEVTEDHEVLIKSINATKGIAQAEPDRKTDQYANLPVFSITFVNGATTITMQPAAPVPLVEEVPPVLEPTPLMVACASVNADLAELFADA